jgi:hypothetical protein
VDNFFKTLAQTGKLFRIVTQQVRKQLAHHRERISEIGKKPSPGWLASGFVFLLAKPAYILLAFGKLAIGYQTLARLASGFVFFSCQACILLEFGELAIGYQTFARLASGFGFLLAKPAFYLHLASWRLVFLTPAPQFYW